jgi:N-acetylglucosaminyldiphosphoundecaprenol N-acetyl-beta-D-mannosaminyltransferase
MRDSLEQPVAVMGLPIASLTVNEAVDALEKLIHSGGSHQVCTTNVDIWLNALSDVHMHRIVAGSSLVLADGMPLVWASKLLGCPLAERVTGVDLVPRLAELSARKGYGIFLLGARPGVAARVARLLERNYPGARIVGAYAPPEKNLAQMDHEEILEQIHAAKPDILLGAFGNPKQEKWIWMHRRQLGVPVSIGVGGSFDMLVGDMRRAPRWIQHCGLEWAMRFMQEPMRLGPRYARDFFGLVRYLPQALLAAWWQRSFRGPSRVTTASTREVMHVNVYGRFDGETVAAVREATRASIAHGLVMVVHLQTVRQTTIAGFGVLLDARRQLLDAGLSLSLAGMNLKTRFALHAWRLQPLFDEWQPAISRRRSRRPATAETSIRIAVRSEQEMVPETVPAQTRIHG